MSICIRNNYELVAPNLMRTNLVHRCHLVQNELGCVVLDYNIWILSISWMARLRERIKDAYD